MGRSSGIAVNGGLFYLRLLKIQFMPWSIAVPAGAQKHEE